MTPPRILIIAGSDSGGGAGIQADIKTVTMLGGHAMTAITAITAQNTLGVQAVLPVPAETVLAQIESVWRDIGVDAVKIGMLGSAETAHAVAQWLERHISPSPRPDHPGAGRDPVADGPMLDPGVRRGGSVMEQRRDTGPHQSPSPSGEGLGVGDEARDASPDDPTLTPPLKERGSRIPIVFDPVMVATSGDTLADADTIAAFARLMRIATVTTPNLPEWDALRLTAVRAEPVEALPSSSRPEKESSPSTGSGRTGMETGAGTILLKGGHGTGDTILDRLLAPDGREIARWANPRLATRHTHGTGCTLASAIATGLGQGMALSDAVARGIAFVRAALAAAPGFGGGHGPMGHALGVAPFDALRG